MIVFGGKKVVTDAGDSENLKPGQIITARRLRDENSAFFDALGNATHTALMFDVIGEDAHHRRTPHRHDGHRHLQAQRRTQRVVVTDVNDYRLEMARKMGATATVNVAHDKLESISGPQHMVEALTCAPEMSGNVAALNTMIDNMRNGGKIALLGIHPGNIEININKVIWNSLTLQAYTAARCTRPGTR